MVFDRDYIIEAQFFGVFDLREDLLKSLKLATLGVWSWNLDFVKQTKLHRWSPVRDRGFYSLPCVADWESLTQLADSPARSTSFR
jgi:hypothetical protein